MVAVQWQRVVAEELVIVCVKGTRVVLPQRRCDRQAGADNDILLIAGNSARDIAGAPYRLTEKRNLGSIKPVTLRSLGSPLNRAEPLSFASGTRISNFPEPARRRSVCVSSTFASCQALKCYVLLQRIWICLALAAATRPTC